MELPVNRFKKTLKEGKQQYGAWHTMGGGLQAEILVAAGYDWILIDSEHGVMEVADIVPALQALTGFPDCAPVVRVAENDAALIKRHLDQGAQTIMVPMINSAEEARAAVAAMRFAPQGVRGMNGVTRASRFGAIKDYVARAHEELCLIVQIESVAGMEALEEIAAVPEVDAIFIGPADLAADMGFPGNTAAPEVEAAVLDCFVRLDKVGMPAGILTLNDETLKRYIEAGSRFTALGIDGVWLLKIAREVLGRFRAL
jgi:4-hydroxy-2-oxoheptanedioate aldolase